jgi:hypothetical protein
MKKILVVALLTFACGSEDLGANDTLIGNWQFSVITNTNVEYGVALSFTKDSTYSVAWGAQLSPSIIGVEGEGGNYIIDEKTIWFTPTNSSCPSHDHTPYSAVFSVEKDMLQLANASGGVIYKRSENVTPANILVKFGCWDNDILTPHSIENL